jgi:DNA-binding transcriptional LysR family regulator
VALSELKVADLPLLSSGEVDLLVDHLPEVPAEVAVRRVGEAHAFIALPSDHRLAPKKSVSLAELTGEPFVAYHADLRSRELQLRALELYGGPPGRMHAADSAESILGLVAAGIGWSLIPWLGESGPRVAGVVTRRLDVPGAAFPLYAAWRKAGPPNPFVQAALELAPG